MTRSASPAGLRIVELHDLAEHQTAAELFCRIWRADSPDSMIGAGMIRALAHAGNYVVGAYDGPAMVAATVAFLGADHLHSHITGVDPARQRGGVGYALKQHQRDWALARGITKVCWTFDPLVRRNAHFNLHKLGAAVTEYLPDFYGPMTDGINTGDASDRLYITWSLSSPRADAAARGEVAEVDVAAVRAGGAAVPLDRARQRPVPGRDAIPVDGRPVLVAVPIDIEALRAADRTLAMTWRYAVRDALTATLAAGYRITGMARDGFYLLEVPR